MTSTNPLSMKNNPNDPLSLLSDLRNRQQYIETVSVYPRFINDSTNGGSMSLVLPKKKAYLSGDSRLILPCTCVDTGYQFPPNVGIFSLIDSVTLRTETGGVICQLNSANDLYAMNNYLTTPERVFGHDSVLEGFNYTFEGGSGSKMNSQKSENEILLGQMRMKTDNYEILSPADVVGRNDAKPNCLSAKNNLLLQTEFKNTAEFSISLNDLLFGLFKVKQQFPLALCSEELILDINFSKNGDYGDNDRAVCCPSLMTHEKTSVVSVAYFKGAGTEEVTDRIVSSGGIRIMFDVSAELNIINIRVLDCGSGYDGSSTFTFTDTYISEEQPLVLHVARKFINWDNEDNFVIFQGGDDFVENDVYTVMNPVNPEMNFDIRATSVDAGELTSCVLANVEQNDNMALSYGTGVLSVVNKETLIPTGALVFCPEYRYIFTTEDNNGAVQVHDALVDADNNLVGYVLAIDGDGYPIEIGTVDRELAIGNVLYLEDDDAVNFTVLAIEAETDILTIPNGLGHDPLHSFNLYDTGRINIVTDQVYLATDLIYYLDGKTERNIEKMITQGYTQLYTQFTDVITSMTQTDGITSYNAVNELKTERQIGFSNEVLRNIMFGISPIGAQVKPEFPYYQLSKVNPLLNKYCSMASLAMDGFNFQINVNSVPYYSSPVETDFRMYTELSKCNGTWFMPKSCYSAWDSCRQLDNPLVLVSSGEPSLQPGFVSLAKPSDDGFVPTKKYEINERKMGICNQLWHGIPQKWALGMSHYNGLSFKFADMDSIPGNGVVVGNNQVDIIYQHSSTFNPWYGGTARMVLFGEVERQMQIVNGIVSVSSSAF